jgi:hypothetical protein
MGHKALRINANQQIGASLPDILNSRNGAVASVSENELVRDYRHTTERLSVAFPAGSRQLEEITYQTRPSQTVQNPPLATRLTWLLDNGAVNHPQRAKRRSFEPRNAIFPK